MGGRRGGGGYVRCHRQSADTAIAISNLPPTVAADAVAIRALLALGVGGKWGDRSDRKKMSDSKVEIRQTNKKRNL